MAVIQEVIGSCAELSGLNSLLNTAQIIALIWVVKHMGNRGAGG